MFAEESKIRQGESVCNERTARTLGQTKRDPAWPGLHVRDRVYFLRSEISSP
jgi:hypothetical protein